MSIAKRHISYGNISRSDLFMSFRYVNAAIGKRRSPNGAQNSVPAYQPLADLHPVANALERLPLSLLRLLTIADVQSRNFGVTNGQRGADTGIHASAQQHNGP